MAYEKQTFIDYPNEGYTTLKAEHLNHIEDGIARALFPEKINDVSESIDLLEDSGEYWNSGFCQQPAPSAQDLGDNTLSAVQRRR